jgi:hypothetical protein
MDGRPGGPQAAEWLIGAALKIGQAHVRVALGPHDERRKQ